MNDIPDKLSKNTKTRKTHWVSILAMALKTSTKNHNKKTQKHIGLLNQNLKSEGKHMKQLYGSFHIFSLIFSYLTKLLLLHAYIMYLYK